MSQLARDRILSARGLDGVARKMRQAQEDMASGDDAVRARACAATTAWRLEFIAGGGYAAESGGRGYHLQPGSARACALPAAFDPFGWPASPRGAGAHPLLEC